MSTIDVKAIGRGAFAGLLVIAPLTALRVVIDRNVEDFDASGWAPLFAVGLFAAYVLAGWTAGRRERDAPLSNGLLAGIGALGLWLVIRVVIWVVREQDQGLFTGRDAVLTPGRIFGAIVFAALFGLVGGLIGARMGGGGEPAGWPRTGPDASSGVEGDPSEERPDSTGQGAG